MLLFLIVAGALWFLGAHMQAPKSQRWLMIGVLYAVILLAMAFLPQDHQMRSVLGEDFGRWALVGVFVAFIWLYHKGLSLLRARVAQNTPLPEQEETQPQTFSDAELERYARHIVLRQVGGTGQKKLKDARILVIGAGGLGAPALLYLGAAGVGTLGIVDDDEVSLSNLQRQICHRDEDIDLPKVFSAKTAVNALNPHTVVKPYQRRLDLHTAETLFLEYDVILDGTDSFESRQIVNKAAAKCGVPVVAGAISQWEGQVTVYDPKNDAPCLQCVFPTAPDETARSCAEAGVLGPLAGIIGTTMALEALKVILGVGQSLRGSLWIYDGLYAESRRIKVKRNKDCSVCG